MKIKLQDIADAIELDTDGVSMFLNVKTGAICTFMDDEIEAAEKNKNLDDEQDWYQEAVALAKDYVDNKNNYLATPSKYEFHEYNVMEAFCMALTKEEQREEMCFLIQGKGAFSNFRRGLDRYGLTNDWYQFKNEKLCEFAREWCENHNIDYQKES